MLLAGVMQRFPQGERRLLPFWHLVELSTVLSMQKSVFRFSTPAP